MAQKPIKTTFSMRLYGAALLGGVLVIVTVGAFAYEVYSAKAAVTRYVGIWEDDIAQAKIFQGDQSLQSKIMSQLKDVHPAVGVTEVLSPEKIQCRFSEDIPITYNSLPSGTVRVCFDQAKLLASAAVSPLFLFGVLLSFLSLAIVLRREFQNQIQEQKLEAELALSRETASLSRQMAHDIRGPLTALTTLSRLPHGLSDDKKELLDLAVRRIQVIASDLLTKGREGEHTARSGGSANESLQCNLLAVIEDLLKEFRFSFPSVQFELTYDERASNAGVPEPIKIQRIMSNLIQNSVESFSTNRGRVSINLSEKGEFWVLQVIDDGCGIPEEILPRLRNEGYSYGKDNGNGLGLFDANKSLTDMGGKMQIQSRLGIGTQILLMVPKISTTDRV